MNFISAFNELDKLYESVDNDRTKSLYSCTECGFEAELFDDEFDGSCPNCHDHHGAFNKCEESLEEANSEEEEVVEDEVPVDEESQEQNTVEEDEQEEVVNKQLVLECAKCGALVIKDESEVTVDEESELANVGEECTYCEESEGFKVIGTFEPYVVETTEDEAPEEEAPEEEAEAEVIEDEVIEEGILDKKPKYALIYKNRDNTISAFALGKSKEGLSKKAEELEADWRAKFEDDFDYDFQVVDLKTASQKITDESEIKSLLADKDGFIA